MSLPYVQLDERRRGRLLFTVTNKGEGDPRYVLRVAGAIPVRGHAELAFVFDSHRYEEDSGLLGRDDLVLWVDPETGATRWTRPGWLGERVMWVEVAPPEGGGARALCTEQLHPVRGRGCQVEIFLPLSEVRLQPLATEPRDDDAPGRTYAAVGFGVVEMDGSGGLPEGMAEAVDTYGQDSLADRKGLLTLLFREPPSAPIRVASWNVARWSSWLEWWVTGSPFECTPLGELAAHIADYDLVGLQELWSAEDAAMLLRLVNEVRAERGLAPMRMYGPPEFAPTLRDRIEQVAGVATLGAEHLAGTAAELFAETHGGTWVFTHLPVFGMDTMVYSRCRGEDCAKAKGAVWVRVGLEDDGGGRCRVGHASPSGGCHVPPHADQYVDVFVTHLQAQNPAICGSIFPVVDQIRGLRDVLFSVVDTVTGGDGDNCTTVSDRVVQWAQLRQLGRWIDAIVDGRHPAVILGDLNVDGRRLNRDAWVLTEEEVEMLAAWFGEEPVFARHQYGMMLDALGVGPDPMDTEAPAPDDRITPYPDAFSWDVDHGDVMRQRFRGVEPSVLTRCGVGTAIGSSVVEDLDEERQDARCRANPSLPDCVELWSSRYPEGWTPIACGFEHHYRCDAPFDERLDYVLVRAPLRWGYERRVQVPPYLLGRDPEGPIWESPFPERFEGGTPSDPLCGGPPPGQAGPGRLSDHRLVSASLRLYRFDYPDRFHPEWNHRVRFFVESFDATGYEDCIASTCAPTDPYPRMRVSTWFVDGTDARTDWEAKPHCTDQWVVSRAADGAEEGDCAFDWRIEVERQAAEVRRHHIELQMWEKDDTSADDQFEVTSPPRDLRLDLYWADGRYRLVNDSGNRVLGWPRGLVPIDVLDPPGVCVDGEPPEGCEGEACERGRRVRTCVRFELEEF